VSRCMEVWRVGREGERELCMLGLTGASDVAPPEIFLLLWLEAEEEEGRGGRVRLVSFHLAMLRHVVLVC